MFTSEQMRERFISPHTFQDSITKIIEINYQMLQTFTREMKKTNKLHRSSTKRLSDQIAALNKGVINGLRKKIKGVTSAASASGGYDDDALVAELEKHNASRSSSSSSSSSTSTIPPSPNAYLSHQTVQLFEWPHNFTSLLVDFVDFFLMATLSPCHQAL